jgi:hypothetical protein
MEEPNTLVIEAVIGVVGALLSWAIIQWRQFAKSRVENEYFQGLLFRLTDAVETAVREAAQTTVPAIKRAAQDGRISPDEALLLKKRAREVAVDQLAKLDREGLEKLFDRESLERKLDQLIEAQVQRLKG